MANFGSLQRGVFYMLRKLLVFACLSVLGAMWVPANAAGVVHIKLVYWGNVEASGLRSYVEDTATRFAGSNTVASSNTGYVIDAILLPPNAPIDSGQSADIFESKSGMYLMPSV